MLVSYLNAIEKVLLAKSCAASKAGHPNLRGGPREWFIEEFLVNHLPSSRELGQGEIISEDSEPEPAPKNYRNQNDLVIYRRDFPKISYSPRDKAYLIQGVIATIEVKSKLTKGEFRKACKASEKHKTLIPEIQARLGLRVYDNVWRPSHIISYVVAYDAQTENLSTIAKWLPKLQKELGVESKFLVDMIVILGKGIIWRKNAFPAYKIANIPEDDGWAYIEQEEKNVYTMFTHMLTIVKISSYPPEISGYINQLTNSGIKWFA